MTITIANIYLPGSANFELGEMCKIINSLPNPKIIVGDFNAHNTVWGNESTDRRGRILEAIFVEQGLNVMNSGSATHTSGTAIDLTVASPLLAVDMQWEVLLSPLSSDHFQILITLRSKSNQNNLQDGYNHHKGRWKEITADSIWQQVPEDVWNDPE